MPEITNENADARSGDRYSDDRRAQAVELLPVIADRARSALVAAGIHYDVCLLVPRSGNACLLYGTMAHPSDEEWARCTDIISRIAEDVLDLAGTISRDLASAAVHPAASSAAAARASSGDE